MKSYCKRCEDHQREDQRSKEHLHFGERQYEGDGYEYKKYDKGCIIRLEHPVTVRYLARLVSVALLLEERYDRNDHSWTEHRNSDRDRDQFCRRSSAGW